MKQILINFLKMLGVVLNGMNNERSLWENEPEIASMYSELETEYNLVNSLSESVSATDPGGLTDLKDNTFDRLLSATYKLMKKMSAYAKKNNKLTLLPSVGISYSALSRGPEPEAVNRCAGIADKAMENLENMSTYKVTGADIENIRQLVNDYRQQSSERTTVSKDKSEKGAEIDGRIKHLRSNLDIMDDLVKGLIDDREFINRYKSWRSIIDYGKGKTLKNKAVENQQ